VRQAINLAFDKANYVKAVFEDTAEPANGPYPPNTWSYAKNLPGYPHDVESQGLAGQGRTQGRLPDHHLDPPVRQPAQPEPEPGRAVAAGRPGKIGIRPRSA
jgi:peptide/nickel transport system substrate-binding protein